ATIVVGLDDEELVTVETDEAQPGSLHNLGDGPVADRSLREGARRVVANGAGAAPSTSTPSTSGGCSPPAHWWVWPGPRSRSASSTPSNANNSACRSGRSRPSPTGSPTP